MYAPESPKLVRREKARPYGLRPQERFVEFPHDRRGCPVTVREGTAVATACGQLARVCTSRDDTP
ncbi:hypothetical protein RAJCM14343_4843 [Rhodococcus aetherivorans]|uniref:Mobile element protein n=1 Tax=Rhodococcus aetherivorans TaxID=191292 RepID=A0ABQ0YSQ5_9NOCA|nr:hypothetical protein RAJCM14343_4843 [Rhodococcus aetherivorans]